MRVKSPFKNFIFSGLNRFVGSLSSFLYQSLSPHTTEINDVDVDKTAVLETAAESEPKKSSFKTWWESETQCEQLGSNTITAV